MTSISITFELGRCLSQELLSHIYHLSLRSVLIPMYAFSQGCMFSMWSERKAILSWPSCVSSWIWWVAMVLQEGCHGVGEVPNRETCLKKPCPWLQPALSYLHHLLYGPASTEGKTEKHRGQLWGAWGSSACVAGRGSLSRDAMVLGACI